MTQILWGLGGSLVILAAAWLLSINRRAINWRTVGVAMVTLVAFSFAVLRWSFGRAVLETLTEIAPKRRGSVARLGVRAVLAGTLANLLNAAVAGMFV